MIPRFWGGNISLVTKKAGIELGRGILVQKKWA